MKVFSSSFINVVPLVILLVVTGNNSAPNKKPAGGYQDASEKFSKLLTIIANMNEKRLNALKDYTDLDLYKAGNSILRQVNIIKGGEITVLRGEMAKAIIYDTLNEVICKGSTSEISSQLAKNEILSLNDENTKAVVNDILREMICTKTPKRPRKSPRTARLKRSNRLHQNYNHGDFEVEPLHYVGNKASVEDINIVNALKKYMKSDKHKVGNAIFKEGGVMNNKYNLDEILLINDGNTKGIIYDVIHEMVCKDGISPELSSFRDVILRAGKSKMNGIRLLMDENTKAVINEILLEIICKEGIRKNLESKSSASPWLRHTNQLMANYYDDHIDINNQMVKINPVNHIRNKYSSEDSLDKFKQENGENRDDDKSRNDDFFDDDANDWNDDLKDAKNRKDDLTGDDRKGKDRITNDDKNETDDISDDDDDMDQKDNLSDVDTIDSYSKVLRSSCWKEATKHCKKACKSALSEVCNDYMCSSRMKKAFKKKCKSKCKE